MSCFFFVAAQALHALTLLAPANKAYCFSFSPCEMWGDPGMNTICPY